MVLYLFQVTFPYETERKMVFMDSAERTEINETKKPSVVKRAVAVFLVTVLLLGIGAYGGLYVLLKGPSLYLGTAFVAAVADNDVMYTVLQTVLTPREISEYQQMAQSGNGEDLLYAVHPQLG